MVDTRSLSSEAKEALRLRAIHAYEQGHQTQGQMAKIFGVARQTLCGWFQTYRREGEPGLQARKVGCPPGYGLLRPQQERDLQNLIETKTPDQLGLPYDLWTRGAVRELVAQQTGITVPVRTVGKWLKKWGFTPQKPIRKALEQDREDIRHWREEDYPAIVQEAQSEQAEIQWGDQMGLCCDDVGGLSYSPQGKTPVILGSGKRCRCNLIASVSNTGALRFQVFSQTFTTDVFLDFLTRLIHRAERKIYLIVDRHPVHKAKKVQDWVKEHEERIRLILMPAYGPELNPVEYMNQDVKTNAGRRKRARSQAELTANLRGYMYSTQKHPEIVRNYFQAPNVQYALPLSA